MGSEADVHRSAPVAVRVGGEPPQVVLVHGAMDRAASFGRLARRLAPREVVRYDRRGYARSRPLGVGSLADHVADLAAMIDEGPAVVVGHSAGGVVAAGFAATPGSPVLGLVVYEAPMPWCDWWPRPETGEPRAVSGPEEEAEAFMRQMVGDRVWQRLPAATRAERRSEGLALRADLAMVRTAGPPVAFGAITVPVLSITGSESSWWQRRAAEQFAAEVPDGALAVLEGAGHGGHLTHPAALADAIDAFVRGLA
jgi:pimeloyl-ACP methyl ester carboxylesterase